MATQLNNIKISLRRDTLENWNKVSSSILLPGEIAIVSDDDEENIKIGNGISSFSQLPYLYQHNLKTENLTAKDITAKSIAQGYNVKASPTSLATGVLTQADGNFDVVHGIEATVSDDYSFVFNGVNFPGIFQRYVSHGEGTFNINAVDGLSGIYIGERNLASILKDYILSNEISNYYTKDETDGLFSDTIAMIEAVAADSHEYTDSRISSIPLSDYYKKNETSSSSELCLKFSTLSTYVQTKNQLSNDGYLTSHQSLDDYYRKSETSSSTEISNSIVRINSRTDSLIAATVSEGHGYTDRQISAIPLSSYGKTIQYDSSLKKIYLKNDQNVLGTVDCADFIKDGMLSSVELCGNIMIFKFNTDAGTTPISVNLSSFVDNYDQKILELSTAISVIGSDYLDSSDKIDILNRCIERDEIKFYYGPETKQISLSIDTGNGNPLVQTVTLSDFYSKDETDGLFSDVVSMIEATVADSHEYTDSKVSSAVSSINDQLSAYGKTLTYDTQTNKIQLKNGQNVLGEVDCSSFFDIYTAGNGLCCENKQFRIDTDVVAVKNDLSSKVERTELLDYCTMSKVSEGVWEIGNNTVNTNFETVYYGTTI